MRINTLLSPDIVRAAEERNRLNQQLEFWLDEVAQFTEFTPDLHELEQYEWVNLFVYGDLMERHRAHNLMENDEVERLAIAYTQEEYSVEKKELGTMSFPIATRGKHPRRVLSTKVPLRVRGELYRIRPYHMLVVDNHMRNTVEFMRKRVNVVVPYSNRNILERLQVVETWMHFGVQQYWGQLEGWQFKPVQSFERPDRPWMKRYYFFSKLECQTPIKP